MRVVPENSQPRTRQPPLTNTNWNTQTNSGRLGWTCGGDDDRPDKAALCRDAAQPPRAAFEPPRTAQRFVRAHPRFAPVAQLDRAADF